MIAIHLNEQQRTIYISFNSFKFLKFQIYLVFGVSQIVFIYNHLFFLSSNIFSKRFHFLFLDGHRSIRKDGLDFSVRGCVQHIFEKQFSRGSRQCPKSAATRSTHPPVGQQKRLRAHPGGHDRGRPVFGPRTWRHIFRRGLCRGLFCRGGRRFPFGALRCVCHNRQIQPQHLSHQHKFEKENLSRVRVENHQRHVRSRRGDDVWPPQPEEETISVLMRSSFWWMFQRQQLSSLVWGHSN